MLSSQLISQEVFMKHSLKEEAGATSAEIREAVEQGR